MFFFFQAEDGIRDRDVTGVQTCALPISHSLNFHALLIEFWRCCFRFFPALRVNWKASRSVFHVLETPWLRFFPFAPFVRSEERRVGKECRFRTRLCICY